MSHPDRQQYLGAYDIAAIVGCSPYSSPAQVVMVKRGLIDPQEITEAMTMGLLFEDAILARAEQDIGPITDRGRFISHPDHAFLGGTIDGIADATLVDAKNLNYFSLREWEDNGPPELYIVQLNYYAALLNASGEPVIDAKLACVFGGQTFRLYDIPLDKDLGDLLINKGVEFWNKYIIGDEEPDLSAAPCELLERYYNKSDGTEIALQDDKVGVALREYIRLRDEIKTRDEALRANKGIIEAAMGNASKGVYLIDDASAISVSWSDTHKRAFDAKAFQSDHPDLYDMYVKDSTYRVLRVTAKDLTKKIAARKAA